MKKNLTETLSPLSTIINNSYEWRGEAWHGRNHTGRTIQANLHGLSAINPTRLPIQSSTASREQRMQTKWLSFKCIATNSIFCCTKPQCRTCTHDASINVKRHFAGIGTRQQIECNVNQPREYNGNYGNYKFVSFGFCVCERFVSELNWRRRSWHSAVMKNRWKCSRSVCASQQRSFPPFSRKLNCDFAHCKNGYAIVFAFCYNF